METTIVYWGSYRDIVLLRGAILEIRLQGSRFRAESWRI